MQLFVWFSLLAIFVSSKTFTVEEALQAASGIYKDPSKSVTGMDLNATLLVTASNFGYLNQMFNFKCYMERLNWKYVVMALDRNASNILENDSPYDWISIRAWEDGQEATTASSYFREADFNFISVRKIELTYRILRMGYNVIFIDNDIPVINDFLPLLAEYDDMYDFLYSKNDASCGASNPEPFNIFDKSEGNTGFYYVKSNVKNWDLWSSVYLEAKRFPQFDDQTIFWNVIRNSPLPAIYNFDTCGQHKHTIKFHNSHATQRNGNLRISSDIIVSDRNGPLRICGLDECLFSCSVMKFPLILKTLKDRHQVPYTMHANYIIGNEWKEVALNNHHMWLVSHPFDLKSVTCKHLDESMFTAV